MLYACSIQGGFVAFSMEAVVYNEGSLGETTAFVEMPCRVGVLI
jgi:hypothetical protein